MRYNLRRIRLLLTESFSAEELRDFCFDTEAFRPVYHQLAENTGKADLVNKLLVYAYEKSKLHLLLNWAKEQNPDKYTQYYPYTTEEPDPPSATLPGLSPIPATTVSSQPTRAPRSRQTLPFILLGGAAALCLLLSSAAFVILPKLWPAAATAPVEQAAEFAPVTTAGSPTLPSSNTNNDSAKSTETATPSFTSTPLPPTATTVATPDQLTLKETSENSTPLAPAATPTLVTEDIGVLKAAIANAVVVFEDDFSSNTIGWFEGRGEQEWGDYSIQFLNGQYRYIGKSKKPSYSVISFVPNLTIRDFRLSLEATLNEASDRTKDTHLIIEFRRNERGDYYLLWFNLDNTYGLGLWKDNQWRLLHQASGNDNLKLEPGLSNTFELMAAGSQFTIYANNQLLATVTDLELNQPGAIRFGAQLTQIQQVVTVDFDNLKIEEIPLDKTRPEIEATTTAAAIAAATARSAPAATEVARATAIAQAAVLFQDDFSTNINGWWTGEDNDHYGLHEAQLINGKYRRLFEPQGTPSFSMFEVPGFHSTDFWLQVEVTLVETSAPAGQARVGITFRQSQNRMYSYQVTFSNNQTYQVDLWQNGQWKSPSIQAATSSPAINLNPGVTNTLAVLVKGSIFAIYANGQKLSEETDITLQESGQIKLGIAVPVNQTLTVDFDNLVIKEAP